MIRRASGVLLATVLAFAGCSATPRDDGPRPPRYDGWPVEVDGLKLPARVEGDDVQIAISGRFETRFWPGVNLGSTIPGHLAGEVASTRSDYDRWLSGMRDLGVRLVRVYTILTPDFYDALVAHNEAHPGSPIYVLHGVWLPSEERWLETRNAYEDEVSEPFRDEIDDAVAVVHGDADLPMRRGHAGGAYRSDISRWLLGWSLGIEWDPHTVKGTDELNAGAPPHRGRFIASTDDATPMESWLASMLDHLAAQEADRGWSRPLTITNWVTTDPLDHTYEPMPNENLVSIDTMHVRPTGSWPAGIFASYHVYPYYPAVLKHDPAFQSHRRPDGEKDPYAGYLHRLKQHHRGQAVMVTEFGIPNGIGIAHRGPAGRDQGGHSELEASRMRADLMRAIQQEGYAGGVLFSWVDEWSKSTWNTMEVVLPRERRQLWHDVLTNEEQFGVVAAEPGNEPVVVVDGDPSEWAGNVSALLAESRDLVTEVRAIHDEGYLYLLLSLDQVRVWDTEPIWVGLDVRPQGNGGLPGIEPTAPDADVAVIIGPGDVARFRHAAFGDVTRVRYGVGYGYVQASEASLQADSGAWVSPRLLISRPHTLPWSGEQQEAELVDLGLMRWGTADPDADDFDDRVLVSAQGRTIELRLPWALIGFSDPSDRRILVPQPTGSHQTLKIDRLGIVVAGEGWEIPTPGYSWDEWNGVSWHERNKRGFDDLRTVFRETAIAGVARR